MKWDFLLRTLEIAILQVRVMGTFPVCEELFPVITATFRRKMSSIFTHGMYRVILPTHILLCQTFHLSCSGRRYKTHVCCHHQRSRNGDPFVSRRSWDFSSWGKHGWDSWLLSLSLHPHGVCRCCCLKHKRSRAANQTEISHPTYQWSRCIAPISPSTASRSPFRRASKASRKYWCLFKG